MSAHDLRHMTWKYHHPNATPRTMQNPQAWIGKVIPADIDPNSITFDFCECDHCDRAFASIDDLRTFMCPEWNQRWAWELLRGLGHDAAEMFCDDCYTKLSWQAEKIVPNWYHYYCEGYMELPETPEQESPEPDYVEAWLGEPLAKAFAVAACDVGDDAASYEAPAVADVTAATPTICADCNGTGWIDIDEFEAVSCTCGASGYPAEPKITLVDVDETFAAVPVGEYEDGFSVHSEDRDAQAPAPVCLDCGGTGYHDGTTGVSGWCLSCNPADFIEARRAEKYPFSVLIETGNVEAVRALANHYSDMLLNAEIDAEWMPGDSIVGKEIASALIFHRVRRDYFVGEELITMLDQIIPAPFSWRQRQPVINSHYTLLCQIVDQGEPPAPTEDIGMKQIDLGVQEPPQNSIIFNRRREDGTYRPLSEFFDGKRGTDEMPMIADDDVNIESTPITTEPKHEEVAAALALVNQIPFFTNDDGVPITREKHIEGVLLNIVTLWDLYTSKPSDATAYFDLAEAINEAREICYPTE